VCKEDAKEVLVSQNVGGGKQLDRAFHFDKVHLLLQMETRVHTLGGCSQILRQHTVEEELSSSWYRTDGSMGRDH
jgi:hypothetical protein